MNRTLFRLAVLVGSTTAALRERLTTADLAVWIAYMETGK